MVSGVLRQESLDQTERKREIKREAGFYFFKGEDALRVKVTAPSDAVYHCHLLMQIQDKCFGHNF